jgi:transposase
MSFLCTLRNRRKQIPSGSSIPRPVALFERLRREIERLRKENKDLRKKLVEDEKAIAEFEKKADLLKNLEKELVDRDKKIEDLDKKIEDLEHQLAGRKKDSSNSSKPPSSDDPAAGKRVHPQRKKSGRKPGGQKGHPGRYRALVPAEKADTVIEVFPSACTCGHKFPKDGKGLCKTGKPHRHQVTELPEIRPHITEYQFWRIICPDCGKVIWAPVPRVILNQFGPKLTALLAYLTVVCRMPRRKMAELLENVLATPISLGRTQKAVEESSMALQTSYQELEGQLPKEPVLNGDETGWRDDGVKLWLWVFVARFFAFFTIAKSRGSEVLYQVLGPQFLGILCTDRFSAYIKYHKGVAQFCWAHLKRDLLGVQQFARTTVADHFARDALALHARLFRLWHRFRRGDFDRDRLIQKSVPLEKKFFALAEKHVNCADREVRALARLFFTQTERLFAFIRYPGVEPTNNISERTLRTAVQWRKTSFGNRSKEGEIATARLLTAAATCKMQQRNILEFLADTVRLHRAGLPTPSLLPQPIRG